jgi:DNA-binding IclR family transcriptional regulator
MSVKLPEGRNLSLSVRRVLNILDYLSDHEGTRGCTLTEISTGLDMNKSTLFSLLRTLQEYDVVDKDLETDRYKLGLRTLYWAEACLSDIQLRKIASPFLHKLMSKVSETVHLVVYDKGEVVYIDKVESPHAIRMVSRIGSHMPAYSTAVGKAFLANLPEENVREAIDRGLHPRTVNTITTQEALFQHLEEVRRLGYAVDNEENEPQVRCIAAPIFDHTSQVIAAISISGPTIRVTTDKIEQLGQEVKSTAFSISKQLGYRQERG